MNRRTHCHALAAAAVTLLISQQAFAGAPAAMGAALSSSDAACFQRSTTGAVGNNCEHTAIWCMGDYVPTSGAKSVVINGFQPTDTTNLLRCAGQAYSKSGVFANGEQTFLNVVNTSADLPPIDVNVPQDGYVYVCCVMDYHAVIHSMNFHPYE